MLNFNQQPIEVIDINGKPISCFPLVRGNNKNIDIKTVKSFGQEWIKFHYFSDEEINKIAEDYFDILDDSILNENSILLDLGCGSGRWAKYLSKKVKFIESIDPSDTVKSAAEFLSGIDNVRVSKASSENIPFDDNSFDLGLSIGVLHHIPDTQVALRKLVEKVKIGGYVYLYLYYDLDNRGSLYRGLYKISNIIRIIVSKLPSTIKKIVCDLIAYFVYIPIISISRTYRFLLPNSAVYEMFPLSYYIDKTINVIRNDSLDRFGTPLENRFSKKEIEKMMIKSGLIELKFSEKKPYWHIIGKRSK